MKYLIWFFRLFVGLLFIFSGLIKANDPLGLSYKMNEFFEVWGLHFLNQYSLIFSVLMIAFEIIAGVGLILGYAFRLFSRLLLALILFFTFLTAYVLFSGKIKECGCFGDCIKITPWQTFTKDLILLGMILVLYFHRHRIKPLLSPYPSLSVLVLTTLFSFGIQWWTLEHLPFYDCLPFKAGSNILEGRKPPPGSVPDLYESVMIYEKDGKTQEFTMEDYPWDDSSWMFVDRIDKLVRKGNADPPIKDFFLTDSQGEDQTEAVLGEPGYQFFFFVRDARDARTDRMDRLQRLYEQSRDWGIPFRILSSRSHSDVMPYLESWNLDSAPVYVLDGTVSKTAMRSNPGLMLLRDGTVVKKWSFRDYPRELKKSGDQLNWE